MIKFLNHNSTKSLLLCSIKSLQVLTRIFMQSWKTIWQIPFQRYEWMTTLLVWLIVILSHPVLLEYFEFRHERILLHDYILAMLPCWDMSYPIFFILYGSMFFFIWKNKSNPALCLKAIQTYLLIQSIRLVTMYLLPLDSPAYLIPLRDPLLEATFYKGNCYTRDLFYSGHVATMCCLFWVEENRVAKRFFLITALLMSILILIQHIHYSIDVVGAWIFSYIAYYAIHTYTQYKKQFIMKTVE